MPRGFLFHQGPRNQHLEQRFLVWMKSLKKYTKMQFLYQHWQSPLPKRNGIGVCFFGNITVDGINKYLENKYHRLVAFMKKSLSI